MRKDKTARIMNARSLNDVLAVVQEIQKEVTESGKEVKGLTTSLSEDITFDSRTARNRKKISEKITKFVAPSSKELASHLKVVDSLYQNSQELDAAAALIRQSFRGNKKQPAALAAVEKLQNEVHNSLNDAFDALSRLADKHLPQQVETFVSKVVSEVISRLSPKSYKDITQEVYVTPDPTNKTFVNFSNYITVHNLKSKSGFTFDTFFIVVTANVAKDGAIKFFITSLNDFRIPGRFPVGKFVSSVGAALNHVSLLLSHNDFILEHERMPLPFEEQRAKTGLSLPGVESVSVKDDEITVKLAASIKTDAAQTKVLKDILARLNALTRNSARNIFTYKAGLIRGQRVLKFVLTPNADRKSGLTVNLTKLDEMAQLFNLSPQQKEAFKQVLINH